MCVREGEVWWVREREGLVLAVVLAVLWLWLIGCCLLYLSILIPPPGIH